MTQENKNSSDAKQPWKPARQPSKILYKQLAEYIRSKADTGKYPEGYKFPPFRTLESRFGVSRNTLTQTFSLLVSEGVVEKKDGFRLVARKKKRTAPTAGWGNYLGETLLDQQKSRRPRGDMWGVAAEFGFQEIYWDALQKVSKKIKKLPSYNFNRGEPSLLSLIAVWLKQYGIHADESQILITDTISTGRHLTAMALLNPGTTVLSDRPFIEAETLHTLTGSRLHIFGRNKNGADFEAFMAAAEIIHNPVLHIEPVCSWYDGADTDPHTALMMAEYCAGHGIPLVEGDYQRELLSTKAMPPLKASDKHGNILYHSAFLPSVTPSGHLSYLVGPEYVIEQLMITYSKHTNTTSYLNQLLLAELLKSGIYEKWLQGFRQRLQGRMQQVVTMIEHYLKGIAFCRMPSGGAKLRICFYNNLDRSCLGRQNNLCEWHTGLMMERCEPNAIVIYPASTDLNSLEFFIKSLALCGDKLPARGVYALQK